MDPMKDNILLIATLPTMFLNVHCFVVIIDRFLAAQLEFSPTLRPFDLKQK
jgi:hypothetical protein